MPRVSAGCVTEAPKRWTQQGLFTVAFLGICAGVQMSDMGLQAVSLPAIQQTFGISDAAIGALQGLAGLLVGSLIAIPLARFADKYSRKRILLCLILASTVMMVLSALAPNFPLFFIGRSAAGIAEFAMVPLVYSMIPDIAPERHRVAANLGFAALMAIGASAGFYFSGALLTIAEQWIALDMPTWRKAFLLLSFAGVPLLMMGMLTLDPARRTTHPTAFAQSSLLLFLHQHWRAIALFAGMAGCLLVAVQALNQLVTLALDRRFQAGPGEIGQAMGIIVLLTTVGCLPVAGLLDRALSRRFGKSARPLITGICVATAAGVMLVLSTTDSLEQALMGITAYLFLTCTANALVPTMLQDLAPATLRARSFAIWSFVVSIFSASGPVMAGMLSDHFFDGRLMQAIAVTAIPALLISAICAWRYILLASDA